MSNCICYENNTVTTNTIMYCGMTRHRIVLSMTVDRLKLHCRPVLLGLHLVWPLIILTNSITTTLRKTCVTPARWNIVRGKNFHLPLCLIDRFFSFFFLILLAISEAKNETVYSQIFLSCSKLHFRTKRKLSWKRYLRSNHNIKSYIITFLSLCEICIYFFKFKQVCILTKSLFIVEGIWHTLLQIIY